MHTTNTPAWQNLFVGRRVELEHLELAWRRAKGGDPQFGVLLAETGMGKTRLVQQFYSWLSQHEDAPDPDGYWPDWLEMDRNSLSVTPTLPEVHERPSIPWLWWGLRFTNPQLRNRTEASQCGLVNALPRLTPHFAPLQREKEARGESVQLGINSMTALVGILGMATLGPVVAPVVAALGTLSALKEKVDLLLSAKKIFDLKSRDDPSLAERALTERQDAVERITTYFTALLTKGANGKGSIPVVLVIDDAQWIDTDSLAFLDRLYRNARARGWPLRPHRKGPVAADCSPRNAGEDHVNRTTTRPRNSARSLLSLRRETLRASSARRGSARRGCGRRRQRHRIVIPSRVGRVTASRSCSAATVVTPGPSCTTCIS